MKESAAMRTMTASAGVTVKFRSRNLDVVEVAFPIISLHHNEALLVSDMPYINIDFRLHDSSTISFIGVIDV